MIIIRAIAFLLHFTIIPVALGRLITYKQTDNKDSAIATYIIGLFGSFAIFYVLCSLLEWHQYWNTFTEPFTGCFTALCIAYSVVIAILLIVWMIKDKAAIKASIGNIKKWLSEKLNQIKANKFLGIYMIAFAAILIVQLYFAFAYEINEWSYDDYDYVVNSQDTITTDTIAYANYVNGEMPYTAEKRAVTAWPTFIAYMAKVSSFEVTTVCHTIMPVILLIVAYIVYYYIASFIFKDAENRFIFLVLLSVANIFGLYSHYSSTFRLLGAIWQGKALLTAVAIPFFTIYLFETYKNNFDKHKVISLAMISLGAASLTTMSALLITITVVSAWIAMSIYNRKIVDLRYLISSLFGVIYLVVFYTLMSALIKDMHRADGEVFFKRGRDINWWYKWFG